MTLSVMSFDAECRLCWISQISPLCWESFCSVSWRHFKLYLSPSVFLSICLFIFLSVSCIYLSFYLSLSFYSSVCLFISQSIFLSMIQKKKYGWCIFIYFVKVIFFCSAEPPMLLRRLMRTLPKQPKKASPPQKRRRKTPSRPTTPLMSNYD
jgi:hypothetical protein